jgi:hypothetical protein
MGKRKRTFTDPQTGEEIESTALAQWGPGLAYGLLIGLPCGLLLGLFGLFIGWGTGIGVGLLIGLLGGLAYLLVFGLLVGWFFKWGLGPDEIRIDPLARRVHDSISRRQHLRRQRILRRQEFPHVPDGALSRALPPAEPEPTAASLSLAAPPGEAVPRLTAGVDEANTVEERVMAAREPL